jgi:4-amino-4-deoxy-L-arabinose transferase-like glycosyltransferase
MAETLQEFRDEQLRYHQKSHYQSQKNDQFDMLNAILTTIFYLLCIVFVYLIYRSSYSNRQKLFYIALVLAYPAYIFHIENFVYQSYIYTIAFIRGIPIELVE